MIESVSTFGLMLDLNRIDVQEFEMYFLLPVKAQVMLVLSTGPGASSQGCRASEPGPVVPGQGRASTQARGSRRSASWRRRLAAYRPVWVWQRRGAPAAHGFVGAAGWHAAPRVLIRCQLSPPTTTPPPPPPLYFVPQLVYTQHPPTESRK